MPAVKTYTRVNFQNYPSTSTPLNATNLNKMDKGIDDLDDEVVTVKNAIENMSFDADSISYDNTSSGLQATDVQDAVDEINDNLNVHWNPTTDRFEVKKNGNWVESIRAFVNSIPVWVNGTLGVAIANGTYNANSALSKQSFLISGNNLISSTLSNGQGASIVSVNLIDFSSYNYVKVKTLEYGEISLDVSSYNSTAYFYVCFYKTSQSYYGFRVGISSSQEYFQTNNITYIGQTEGPTPTTVNITEIVIE